MSKGDIFILVDLKATVAGNHDHPWTGDDGLFARAAAEIERLQSERDKAAERHDAMEARLREAVGAQQQAESRMRNAESERDALKRECEALLSRLTRATDLLDKAGPYVPFGKETKWLVQHISEFLEAPALSPAEPKGVERQAEPVNRRAYEKLIEEDIAALPETMPSLECAHIITVLRDSVTRIYGPLAEPEETEWHPEAESAGYEARCRGYAQNARGANPYVDYGPTHWMYRSFIAGWCDADQSILSGDVPPGAEVTVRREHIEPKENGHPCETRCPCTTDGAHKWERYESSAGETGMVCRVCRDGYPTLG